MVGQEEGEGVGSGDQPPEAEGGEVDEGPESQGDDPGGG